MSFKIFLIFSSGSQNGWGLTIGNFVRAHYDKHFFEIILNVEKENMSFKILFIYSSSGPSVHQNNPFEQFW